MARELILKIEMSADGFVGRTNGEAENWVLPSYDDALTADALALLSGAGLHVMGGGAYRDMSPYWPTSGSPFARPMNEIPKLVFSRTERDPAWQGTEIVAGDLVEEIGRRKAEPGGYLLAHGGAGIVQELTRLGLIDEYRLNVHPVALGDGLRPFGAEMRLRLVDSRSYPSGAVTHVYRPA